MHSAEVQAQIDAYVRRAKIDRKPVPPLFLVFESGDWVRAGRVLASNGNIVAIGSVKCVCLLLPVADAPRTPHPDSLTGDGRYVMVAQSGRGCVPLNGSAMEMAESLRV